MAKLTLIGMFNLLGGYDAYGNLFSGIQAEHVPTFPVDLDAPLPPAEIAKIIRMNIIDAILDRAGEFETLYADPEYMRDYIGRVFMRWNPTFKKWSRALQVEYDPLSNYDRTEETTIEHRGDITKDGNNTSTPGVTTKTTQEVSAYSAATLVPDSRVIGEVEGSDNVTLHSTDTFNNDDTTKSHIKGNIGVTTSQQMLQSELDIARFNFYSQIADVMVQELCIQVY